MKKHFISLFVPVFCLCICSSLLLANGYSGPITDPPMEGETITRPQIPMTLDWSCTFKGSGGQCPRDITLDDAGNVYVTGSFNDEIDLDPSPDFAYIFNTTLESHEHNGWASHDWDFDIFLVKLDTRGNFVWGQVLGTPTEETEATSILLTKQNQLFVTGYYGAYYEPYCHDGFITQLDADGNECWRLNIGGAGYDSVGDIIEDGAGNLYACGKIQGEVELNEGELIIDDSLRTTTYFVIRLDKSGDILDLYTANSKDAESTDSHGVCAALCADTSGNLYMTGGFEGTVNFDSVHNEKTCTSTFNADDNNYSSDVFLCKLDSDLDLVWVKSWGGVSPDSGIDVIVDFGGNPIVTGKYSHLVDFNPDQARENVIDSVNSGDDDYWGRDGFLSKFDPDGNLQWVHVWGGLEAPNGYEGPAELAIDKACRIWVVGRLGAVHEACYRLQQELFEKCNVMIFSGAGNLLSESIGGDYISAIAMGIDSAVFMTGHSDWNFSIGGRTVLDEVGMINWFDGFVVKVRLE